MFNLSARYMLHTHRGLDLGLAWFSMREYGPGTNTSVPLRSTGTFRLRLRLMNVGA